MEEVVVWGDAHGSREAGYASPISVLTQEDFAAINVATTEDVVKYEPSIVIRRRFIGDSNGTMGIRGSNMFQTSRSMVFADGVPLHYLLQSRWSGAPRWTMVSASEIARAEVIYGPFSAEYGGNAMGGVVVIESAIPQKREFHFDSSLYNQDFAAYGFDDTVSGYKTFLSYGDKLGDLSLYLSYNHLENAAQPQSYFYGAGVSSSGPVPVTGAVTGKDSRGNPQLWFGDSGVEDTATDNYKVKLAYNFDDWSALLNVAYEDRGTVADARNSYLRDSNGNRVWSGTVEQGGQVFAVPASRMGVSELERDSLSVGLRLRGDLSERSRLEFNINEFQVLRDETRSSGRNPRDPAYTPDGQVNDYGDTGWQTADAKLTVDGVLLPGVTLVSGLRYEAYELNLDVYRSSHWRAGSQDSYSSRSGGETGLAAAFVQAGWDINEQWNLTAGLRYEDWQSDKGYYSDDDPATPAFDIVQAPSQSRSEASPKLSIGYLPSRDWNFRYSIARAYRFPIVEELFSQYQAYNSINEANPDLLPEDGLHQNLMVERLTERGSVRVNLFTETIDNGIESQSTVLPGGASIRTFIPVDEVETDGIEFIANVYGFADGKLDMRFNLAWTDSVTVRNAADPTLEGMRSVRMPEWRGNLMLDYQLRDNWDLGANLQYASDSFGRTDNTDTEDNVYGAQDGYTRLGLKSTYDLENGIALGLGVDNLTDEIAYVAHPGPAAPGTSTSATTIDGRQSRPGAASWLTTRIRIET
ncbi:TonB-dependent receptor [Microbulbifer taiwanensis]|uniref:TonB-dependent receptor n=1 Tax=Microbulbifer taiwanensis TaxID=986746 RepID=UPI00360EAD57